MRLRVPRIDDAFEALIAYLCVVAGIPLVLGAPPPSSIQRLLPELVTRGWGISLAFGGGLVAAGLALRQRQRKATLGRFVMGLRLERAGLIPLGMASLVFAVGIVAVAGWRGVLPGGTYLAFAAACVSRAAQARDIERGLRGGLQP